MVEVGRRELLAAVAVGAASALYLARFGPRNMEIWRELAEEDDEPP